MTTTMNSCTVRDPNRRIIRIFVRRAESPVHHSYLRNFMDPGSSFFSRKNHPAYSVCAGEKENSPIQTSNTLKDFANQLAVL